MKKIQIILVTIFLSLLTTAIASMAYANPTLSVFDCGLLAFDDVSDFGITNNDTELVIHMVVSHGRGYQQAQKRRFNEQEDLGIGKMQLDASFSPVVQVTYNVDTARVKQRTDLDKLIIDLRIISDESIPVINVTNA